MNNIKNENKNNKYSAFQNALLKSDFELAYSYANSMTSKQVFDELYVIAEVKNGTELPYNMLPYAYVSSVLIKNETAENHMLAADLMTMPYLPLPGATEVAAWHSRRALLLEPSMKRALGMIVFLYEHEKTSISEEEYQNALKVMQN